MDRLGGGALEPAPAGRAAGRKPAGVAVVDTSARPVPLSQAGLAKAVGTRIGEHGLAHCNRSEGGRIGCASDESCMAGAHLPTTLNLIGDSCKKILKNCSIFDDEGARTPLEPRAQPTLTQPAHYLGCPSYIPPRRGAHLKGRHVMEAEESRLSLPRIQTYKNQPTNQQANQEPLADGEAGGNQGDGCRYKCVVSHAVWVVGRSSSGSSSRHGGGAARQGVKISRS